MDREDRDTEEQREAVDQPTAKPSPVEPVFGLLEWLAKVSVPLGAMLLAVTALYWVEFIKLYALPVDFSSSGTLSGLPALAAVIAALVGLMALSAMLPMGALVYPFDPEGRTLIHTQQTAVKEDTEARWGGSVGQRWITISVCLTFVWPALLFALYRFPFIKGWLWVIFAMAIIAAYGFILPIYRRVTKRTWPSSSFVIILLSSVLTQLLLAYWVFVVAVETLSNTRLLTLVTAFLVCLMVCAAISGVQFVAAKRYVRGWPTQPPKWVVPVALVTMALPLAYPPLGGAIASYPFRLSPTAGGSCVILSAPSLREKAAWADIADKTHPGQSLPLGFAVRLEDAYYIKLTKNAAIHILPAAMVTKVDGCPKPPPKPATKAASAAIAAAPAPEDERMALAALVTSIFSALAAIAAVFYTVYLWRKSNRPFVTARIATHRGRNVGIWLDILVENAGTQPALEVRLRAKSEDVRAAMRTSDAAAELQRDATRVFFSDVTIPVLPNGRTMSNAFGGLGDEAGDWHAGARIPIELSYRGMDGRRYTHESELLLHDDGGFAQTSWEGPAERDIGHRHVTVAERSNA